MPEDRPDALELVATVRDFLETLRPFVPGYGGFQVRVAANLLAIAERELRLGGEHAREEEAALRALVGRDGPAAELEAELVRRIRTGELGAGDADVVQQLRRITENKLRVANPKYLSSGRAAAARPAPREEDRRV